MMSNCYLSLTRFKVADKDHTFYAATKEPSNTLNSFYFSSEPESGELMQGKLLVERR